MASPYEVFVKISIQNGVSPVLGVLAREFGGLGISVDKLNAKLGTIKGSIVAIGAVSAVAAFKIGTAFADIIVKGNDLVKIQRDMAQAGVTNEQTQRAVAKAWELTGKYQNMSAVEILKMQNDARMTFGNQDKATEHIADFVGAASFLKSYEGHEKGSQDSESLMREINAAMKSGELAGKISPEDMKEHIAQLTAMKVAYGEQLKISTYLAAQRAGGVALRNTSDTFRYGMFPALVQEQGSSAGVMLMTAFNKVVAGVGNRTSAIEEMAKIGLLKTDQIKYDKVGRAIGLKDPDGIKGSRDAAMNFGDWVMNYLKPKLDKESGGDPIRESQIISKLFPDRNAAKAVTEIIQQFTKLSKDAEQMAAARKAMNIGEYNSGSLDYQMEAFGVQWKNLMDALGAPLVKGATEMLGTINGFLSDLAQNASRLDPVLIQTAGRAIEYFIGALAIAAGAGFLAAMAAFIPGGLATIGIAGVVAGIGALASLDFGGIGTGLGKLADAIKELLGISTGQFKAQPNKTPGIFGPGDDTKGYSVMPQSYRGGGPGNSEQPIQIHFHVDGDDVAGAVTKVQMRNEQFPTRAPYSDGYQAWQPPDSNLAFG
jgi:hypothetical protein